MKTLNKLSLSALIASIAQGVVVTPALAAEIEEIVIIGNRLEETIPQDLARYGNRVEVITSEQIQQGGYIDVAQTLQMLVPQAKGSEFMPRAFVTPSAWPFTRRQDNYGPPTTAGISWAMTCPPKQSILSRKGWTMAGRAAIVVLCSIQSLANPAHVTA